MKTKLSLFFILLTNICFAQYNWERLPSAPASWRCDDIYFLNPDTGWVINPYYSPSLTSPSVFGRIFKTTDGGTTWQLLVDSSEVYFRSIGFADALNGWVGNLAEALFTNDTIPLRETHDGGQTWSPVNLPSVQATGICGISVVTDSVIYAYGRYSGPAIYFKTTDKGATWSYKNLSTLALGLIDGHFLNKDTGFIAGSGIDKKAIILATNDGGNTWHTVYHSIRGETDRVWKMHFPSRNIGYAAVEYNGQVSNTVFLKTTNGGKTWVERPFIDNYNEEGIGFINDSVGWIGGDYRKNNYITRDGGNTWKIDSTFGEPTPPYQNSSLSKYSINRFRSFGDTLMYASGNTVYKLKTSRTTSLPTIPNRAQNITNYPNPFNDQTTISYTLQHATDNIVLGVYNIMGQRVYHKIIGSQNAGTQQILFNEPLPSGAYYYSLSTGQYKSIGKMIVVH